MFQPSLYSQTNDIAKTEIEIFLKQHLASKKFVKNSKVLDVGSGDGSVTKMLQDLLPEDFAELIGIDVSKIMVDFANSHKTDKRVDFRVADVTVREDLGEFLGKFDYVFSFFCLNWIQEQSVAWKNMFDLLKPGGQAFAVILSDSAIYRIYEIQSTNKKWFPYMRQVNNYITPYLHSDNREELVRKYLKDAGFSVVVSDILDRKHVYPNEERLKKSVNGVNAFTPEMPPEILDDYLADFHENLQNLDYVKKKVQNEEKSRAMVYQLLYVIAKKPI